MCFKPHGSFQKVKIEQSDSRSDWYQKQILLSIMQIIVVDCCEAKTELIFIISFLRFVALRKAISFLQEFLHKVKWFMNKRFALCSVFFSQKIKLFVSFVVETGRRMRNRLSPVLYGNLSRRNALATGSKSVSKNIARAFKDWFMAQGNLAECIGKR